MTVAGQENQVVRAKSELGLAKPTLASDLDLQIVQRKHALITDIVKNASAEYDRPFRINENGLDKMLNSIAKNTSPEVYSKILKDLSRLCSAVDGPADLVKYKCDIAADMIYELSDPTHRIHDGSSLACALAAREHIKQNPETYTSFMADLVSKGYGYLSTTQDGVKQGLVKYQQDMITGLKNRTLGCAIFQDLLSGHFGCPDEGTMAAHIEGAFESTRGKAGKMFTANKEVSDSPDSFAKVLGAIESCGKNGKAGVLSFIFNEEAGHSKHVFEICKSDGVPAGYIKLSDPRKPGEEFPPKFSLIAKDNRDGTVTIKLSDLSEDNLYLAVVESADSRDFGRTAEVKEWQYRRDMTGPALTSYQYSLPFSLSNEEREKKKKSAQVNPVVVDDPKDKKKTEEI